MNMKDIYDAILAAPGLIHYRPGSGAMAMNLDDNTSINVWHPDLPPPIEAFGNRSACAHRTRMHVLFGSVANTVLSPTRSPVGEFTIYASLPPHVATRPAERTDAGRYNLFIDSVCVIHAGGMYELEKDIFRETKATSLAVELVRHWPGPAPLEEVLVHRTQPLESPRNMPDRIVMAQCFFSTLRKLPKSAVEMIESIQ